MIKFIKKPVAVEAVQFTRATIEAHLFDGAELPAGVERVTASFNPEQRKIYSCSFCIPTVDGHREVLEGDWIVTESSGLLCRVTDETFRATYAREDGITTAGGVTYMVEDHVSRQSEYWRGPDGDAYHERNVGRVTNNIEFFKKIIYPLGLGFPSSVIEFGAGIGENLEALQQLLPYNTEFWAVELNESAAQRINVGNVLRGSILDVEVPQACELVFTKGLLIHIDPSDLQRAYSMLYKASKRYILLCEYFNPQPVQLDYRGLEGLLWKRDFAGEMLDRFPDLGPLAYGFAWSRDEYPQDDLHWFLLEKRT